MKEMIDDLRGILQDNKNTMIVGDFNLCMRKEKNNAITKYLEQAGFTQYVTEPSHLEGGHIDHVYSNLDTKVFDVDVTLYSPYYTYQDHDAFLITIKKVSDKEVNIYNGYML